MSRSIIAANQEMVLSPGSLHTPRHLACLFEKQQLCTRPHILRGGFLINVARKIRRSLFAKNVQPCAKLYYFLGRDEVLNAQFVFLPSGSLHVYIRLQPGQVRGKTVQFKASAKRQHCRRAVYRCLDSRAVPDTVSPPITLSTSSLRGSAACAPFRVTAMDEAILAK